MACGIQFPALGAGSLRHQPTKEVPGRWFLLRFNLVAQSVKNLPVMQKTWVQSLGQGLREGSPGEGNGNPLQYSCLGNPMDREAWRTTVHGVARVRNDLATKLPPTGRQKSVQLLAEHILLMFAPVT